MVNSVLKLETLDELTDSYDTLQFALISNKKLSKPKLFITFSNLVRKIKSILEIHIGQVNLYR
jgi:hypothetical protein